MVGEQTVQIVLLIGGGSDEEVLDQLLGCLRVDP